EQEAQLTEQQTDLKVQIKSDHVGGQIESLKQRISPLEKSCEQRSKRLEEYNQLVRSLELIIDPDTNQFLDNKTQAQKSIKDLEQQQQDKQLELRELENEKTDIKHNIS
ncbi:hypothetical protein, partial [Acinetobacter gyllenbergii]